ncbi:hypothetical protein AB1N83_007217 [Pleurotus pulmonarius]
MTMSDSGVCAPADIVNNYLFPNHHHHRLFLFPSTLISSPSRPLRLESRDEPTARCGRPRSYGRRIITLGTKWQKSAIGMCYERCRIHWFGLRSNRNINGSPCIKLVPITPFPFPRAAELCSALITSLLVRSPILLTALSPAEDYPGLTLHCLDLARTCSKYMDSSRNVAVY